MLYGLNSILDLPGLFFRGYFNDILAGAMILAIANLLLAFGKLRPLTKLLPCLALCLACGLFWEAVTPLYLPDSVGDIWDIAAYMAGGVIWWGVCRAAKRLDFLRDVGDAVPHKAGGR